MKRILLLTLSWTMVQGISADVIRGERHTAPPEVLTVGKNDVTVLSSRQPAKGVTVQTVRDAAGHVYKRAISARKGMGAYGRMPRAEAAAEASSAALAEGFDDWDGLNAV